MLVISLFRALLFSLFGLAALEIYPLIHDMGPIVAGQIAFVGIASYFFLSIWGESRIVSYFNPEDTDDD